MNALITLLFFAQSGSQPAPATLPLSLKRAVEIALASDGSPKIALAEETIKEAQAQQAEARSALLPDLESAANYARETVDLKTYGFRFNIPPQFGFSIPYVVGPFSVFDARATGSLAIVDVASIRKYEASKSNVEAVKTDFDSTKNQVSDQVARAYLGLLRADAALDTARSNLELSQSLLDQARRLRDAGSGTGVDVTRAEVQLANDRQRIVAVENDRRKAALILLRAMGLNLNSTIELTDKLSYKASEVGNLESALADARTFRSELKAQKARESGARLNYSSVKDERLPSLGASANYGAVGTPGLPSQPTYAYGLTLTLPIFDGGRLDARREDSLWQYRQEQTRMRDIEQQVELDVRLAFDSVHSAETEVKTAEEGVRLADQELSQAQHRYQAGVTNGIEVTDAQNRLARARDNQIAALYDYNVARIDLATATGKIREYVNQ